MAKKSNSMLPFVLVAIVAAAVAIAGYKYATQPDDRGAQEKINDALHELQKGVDNATRELEDQRPIDKLEDASKDMLESLKEINDKNQ